MCFYRKISRTLQLLLPCGMKSLNPSECQNSISLPSSWPRSVLLRGTANITNGSSEKKAFYWIALFEGAITTSALYLKFSLQSDEPRNKLSVSYFCRRDLPEIFARSLTHSGWQHSSANQSSSTTKDTPSRKCELITYIAILS